MNEKGNSKKINSAFRTVVEVGFIIFLFYSNLLMGEYSKSGLGNSRGLVWAIEDIFTFSNFLIALISGVVGHLVFEFFRNKA